MSDADVKEYVGMHQGQKKGKEFQAPATKETKVHRRVAARLAEWEKTPPHKHGRQKPGSQAKART